MVAVADFTVVGNEPRVVTQFHPLFGADDRRLDVAPVADISAEEADLPVSAGFQTEVTKAGDQVEVAPGFGDRRIAADNGPFDALEVDIGRCS